MIVSNNLNQTKSTKIMPNRLNEALLKGYSLEQIKTILEEEPTLIVNDPGAVKSNQPLPLSNPHYSLSSSSSSSASVLSDPYYSSDFSSTTLGGVLERVKKGRLDQDKIRPLQITPIS